MSHVRKGAVTFKGGPLDLAGPELVAGQKAPDFQLQNQALEDISLAASEGKTRIIVTVPSLDTSVCSVESKRFDDELASLSGVDVLIVSMDLPFAQKRWCGAEGANRVTTLSAHRDTKFAEDYGVLIHGGPLDRCLARAVFVVDGDGTLKHVEYVKEVAEHPNYDAVLGAARG